MMQTRKIINADLLGAIASVLCLIHCVATPFLFIAKACSAACCADTPVWWQMVDYIFIVISFIAIYYATQNSTKKWIRIALWITWTLLLVTILSETFEAGLFPKSFVYISAMFIVVLHFYNLKYCKCAKEKCCLVDNSIKKD